VETKMSGTQDGGALGRVADFRKTIELAIKHAPRDTDQIPETVSVSITMDAGWWEELADNLAILSLPMKTAQPRDPGDRLDKVGADRLAEEVEVLIERKVIGSRSPAADALLDYREGKIKSHRDPGDGALREALSELLEFCVEDEDGPITDEYASAITKARAALAKGQP